MKTMQDLVGKKVLDVQEYEYETLIRFEGDIEIYLRSGKSLGIMNRYISVLFTGTPTESPQTIVVK